MGRIMAAQPYMRNMMGEVVALRLKSRFLRESRDVKVTSISSPVNPQRAKFLKNVFVFLVFNEKYSLFLFL